MTGVVATIHQPNYLPWLGFFSKVKHSDCFIILDIAQYTKNSLVNRNKIRTKDGWCYLTIPISRDYYGSKIYDVKLPDNNEWMEKHWKTIEHNYKKAEYFDSYRGFFRKLYHTNSRFLCDINEEIIFYLLRCFEIKVSIIKASELSLEPSLRRTDLLIALLKTVGATTYISGPSGRNYLDFAQFEQSNIRLEFHEFKHPIYKQRYSGFEPNMAAIDALLNLGREARRLI